MIAFYRRIRQKLLADGKLSKYLIYAIGEIALVMIGILLALQVNNLNERAKTKQLDHDFLLNIRQELIQDTVAFHDRINWYENINDLIITSAKLLSSTSKLSQHEIDTIRKSIGYVEILTPLYKNINRNNAQLAMGRLERVSTQLNNEYNSYIEAYQSDFEVLSKFGETLQNMSVQYLYPLVEYRRQGLREWTKDEWAIIDIDTSQNNPQFLNTYHRSISWRSIYIDRMKSRINDAKKLMEIIEIELDQS